MLPPPVASHNLVYNPMNIWLVVDLPLWKILVSWDDEIPNILYGKIKNVPNHQPDIILVSSIINPIVKLEVSTSQPTDVAMSLFVVPHKSLDLDLESLDWFKGKSTGKPHI